MVAMFLTSAITLCLAPMSAAQEYGESLQNERHIAFSYISIFVCEYSHWRDPTTTLVYKSWYIFQEYFGEEKTRLAIAIHQRRNNHKKLTSTRGGATTRSLLPTHPLQGRNVLWQIYRDCCCWPKDLQHTRKKARKGRSSWPQLDTNV